MDWAVLMKAVPALDQLRFDPERRTVLREGEQLFLNPFDQRALSLALELRQRGEKITVLSMGPPAAADALKDVLSLGADRAILISDPQLAGSDTLVTARTLVRGLSRFGHDTVLTGRWATDSETGQVGPQVAGLLGVPVLTAVRRLRREEMSGFEVTVDAERGSLRYRASAPIVLTIDEKAAKVRKTGPTEGWPGDGPGVERWNIRDLGLLPAHIGLRGSPTLVTSLRNDEPTRLPAVMNQGPASERAQAAVRLLGTSLALASTEPIQALPPVAVPLRDGGEVLILVPSSDGPLFEAAGSLLSETRRRLPSHWPSAVWVGPYPSRESVDQLARAGAVRLYVLTPLSEPPESSGIVIALQELLLRRSRCAAVMFPTSEFGRAVAGQLSARSGLGLTGDAIAFVPEDDGQIGWEKPAFGGGIIATVRSRTLPSLATIRSGGFGSAPMAGDDRALEVDELPIPVPEGRVTFVDRAVELDPSWGDLETARGALILGTGVGGPEHVPEVLAWAQRLGAAVGATRRVVDAGWAPRQTQVGLTGRFLSCSWVILVGVSGAINHLVGLKRVRTILAINVDEKAPVFRYVDVGVVGRWEEILPLVVTEIERDGFSRARSGE